LNHEIAHNAHAGMHYAESFMHGAPHVAANALRGLIILTLLAIISIRLIHQQLREHPENKVLRIFCVATISFLLLFAVDALMSWNHKHGEFLLASIACFILAAIVAKVLEMKSRSRIVKPTSIYAMYNRGHDSKLHKLLHHFSHAH
jgi:hypothetical protein